MEKGTIVKLMQEFNVHLYKIKENEKVLEKKRIAFVTDYNAINIKCLTKESYCTGLEKTTFCYRIENELRELGDMHSRGAISWRTTTTASSASWAVPSPRCSPSTRPSGSST